MCPNELIFISVLVSLISHPFLHDVHFSNPNMLSSKHVHVMRFYLISLLMCIPRRRSIVGSANNFSWVVDLNVFDETYLGHHILGLTLWQHRNQYLLYVNFISWPEKTTFSELAHTLAVTISMWKQIRQMNTVINCMFVLNLTFSSCVDKMTPIWMSEASISRYIVRNHNVILALISL